MSGFARLVNAFTRRPSSARSLLALRPAAAAAVVQSSAPALANLGAAAAAATRRWQSTSTVLEEGEGAASEAGFSLTLTEALVKRLAVVNEKRGGPPQMLRVSVDSGGCSGFAYQFELDDEVLDDDTVFERSGAKVVVDEISLELISGSSIDYKMELIKRAFVVDNNPNAEQGCGCGISFSPLGMK